MKKKRTVLSFLCLIHTLFLFINPLNNSFFFSWDLNKSIGWGHHPYQFLGSYFFTSFIFYFGWGVIVPFLYWVSNSKKINNTITNAMIGFAIVAILIQFVYYAMWFPSSIYGFYSIIWILIILWFIFYFKSKSYGKPTTS